MREEVSFPMQLDPGETEPAVRKHGMRRQTASLSDVCHRQEIEDLLPRAHRRRYMRIPAQQTTRIREQGNVRAVRGQQVTHRDLRHHPSVLRPSIASRLKWRFIIADVNTPIIGVPQPLRIVGRHKK